MHKSNVIGFIKGSQRRKGGNRILNHISRNSRINKTIKESVIFKIMHETKAVHKVGETTVKGWHK